MRLAVILLLAMPACAVAQTTPPPTANTAKPASGEHKPAPAKPSAAPASAKPPSPKPATATQAPVKSAPAKPAPAKPAAAKHGPPPKPAPKKPAVPPPHPAPAVVPAPVEAPPAEPNKGSDTGLLLPRFAALRSDDVNFRTGPGTRYPIEWVYKRRDLPVEVEREFEKWRLVRDPSGNKGWVHQATLTTGRRTAVVAGTPSAAEHTLRQSANDTAGAVAKLKPGVILRLRSCDANSEWCQAQIGDYRGYIKRSEIWGVTVDEVIQ